MANTKLNGTSTQPSQKQTSIPRDFIKKQSIIFRTKITETRGDVAPELISFILTVFDPENLTADLNELADGQNVPRGTAEEWIGGNHELFNECLTLWFQVLNNRLFEIYKTGEIALSHLLEKVREPIRRGELDEDRLLKAFELKTNNYNKAVEMAKSQETILNQLTGMNETVKDIVKKTISAESLAKEFRR